MIAGIQPSAHTGAQLLQHIEIQCLDESCGFKHRYEFVGHHNPSVRLDPPHQNLSPYHLPCIQADLGLEIHFKIVPLHGESGGLHQLLFPQLAPFNLRIIVDIVIFQPPSGAPVMLRQHGFI